MLSIEENEEYWVAVDQGRQALLPLVKRAQGYLERLTDIHRLDRLRYDAGERAKKSNSNGTTERHQVFRASAWRLYHKLASKTSQFYAEFDAFIRDVDAVFVQLRAVLPAHEIDNLKGKLHPTAIESTCKVVLRTAERVEEFWTARPQSLAHEATPPNSGHDPEPDSQATPSWTDSTAAHEGAAGGSLDFNSAAGRASAVTSYTQCWTCSQASLARTARVHRADLSKWKQSRLSARSDKRSRIEKALENNDRPIDKARRDSRD